MLGEILPVLLLRLNPKQASETSFEMQKFKRPLEINNTVIQYFAEGASGRR
jgi:hypothetical protein